MPIAADIGTTFSAPVRGIQQTIEETAAEPSFCDDALNVRRYGSKVGTRGGTRKVNSVAANGGAPIISQFDFQRADGTRQHLVQAGDTLYKREDGNITTVIRSGVSDLHPLRFAAGLDVVLMTNGEDPVAVWDGTVLKEILAAPEGREIAFYSDHWFIGNIRDGGTGPSRVQPSRRRDYETWDVTDSLQFETGDAGVITGFGKDGDWLAVFKEDTITRIRGTLFNVSSSSFDAQSLPAIVGVGNRSPFGIQQIGRDLAFVDEKGIFSGQNEVTKNMDKFWQERVNVSNFQNIVSAHWAQRKQVWWALPLDGSATGNFVFMWDYRADAVWLYEFPWKIRSLAVVEDNNDIERLYIGSHNGFLYEAEIDTDDDGTAIDAFFETVSLNLGNQEVKHFRFGEATVDAVSSANLSVRIRSDSDITNEANLTVGPMQGANATDLRERIPIQWAMGEIGREIQIRFRNNSLNQPWFLHDYSIFANRTGVVR